jgi:hypothetical protein
MYADDMFYIQCAVSPFLDLMNANDKISTKIIKTSKLFIISPLINICNKMLTQGKYPERLKFSLIKPIYKSGDKSSPSDYRPISLLPTFSKNF